MAGAGGSAGSNTRTMLELLSKQQATAISSGIRWELPAESVAEVTLEQWPYHYCAVWGLTDLAVHLYEHGVDQRPDISIACLHSAGPAGRTPWRKTIEFTPAEAASVAGHEKTAAVLLLIAQGVPLHWSRTNHHLYPSAFRTQVRETVAACIASPGFCRLPGPVRCAVLDEVVTSVTRETVWQHVNPLLLAGQPEGVLAPEQLEAAAALSRQPEASPSGVNAPPLLTYQLRVAAAPARRRYLRGVVAGLYRASVGLTCMAASRRWLGIQGFVGSHCALLTGIFAPTSTLCMLSGGAILLVHCIDGGNKMAKPCSPTPTPPSTPPLTPLPTPPSRRVSFHFPPQIQITF